MRFMIFCALMTCAAAMADFTFEDDGKALTVLENGGKVLVYHYEIAAVPENVPERYRRACYIHPLYSPGGTVLTQDFPFDHRHHRGVFWAWPDSTLGPDDKRCDIWAIDGVRQIHEKWVKKEAGPDKAVISAENTWQYEKDPENPVMREAVTMEVHPAEDGARAIDFSLAFTNISNKVFTLRGATTDSKGYGGFCLRPPAPNKPMEFTTASGVEEEDILRCETPWADVSFRKAPGSEEQAGAAIFQHPDNPGYPHPGWIFRHYAFLGASWPHTDPIEMQPGGSFTLKYRLYTHDGDARKAKVKRAFKSWGKAAK
jgi:hypothetical protein